ncbi:DUF421 domain-containing protein [Arthrobacter antibioticus]|uniref:DUF421 domain-containing protein n=1 Tax=Arthrobacter sp. H35-MC1 TaxID=3046203 RepID=UPI0024BA1673|nr:YetF domain-containing protein [Arthrobacter sp. H35-MC1]MDJ0317871.1 DUF421 domain-containing protein [Arthrobacter sp. H35-MC1]
MTEIDLQEGSIMWNEFGLTWGDAGRVVLSAVGLYALVLLLIRFMGQRTMANLSSFDLAAAVALGAVVGRAILGYTPTLVAGALGLVTLLVLQALTGQLRRFPGGLAAVNNRAYLLMAGSEIVVSNLRRTHVSEAEITARLRVAGIRSRKEVACVILESTGEISVLRAGFPIEPEFLANVKGAELIPASYLAVP